MIAQEMIKTLVRRAILEQNAKLDFFKNQYLEPKKEKTPRKGARKGDDEGLPEPEIGKDNKPKRKKKMSEKYLLDIIKADPTSIVDQNAKSLDDVKKVGGYTQWIVNQYFKIIPEDFAGKKDERYNDIREKVRLFFEDLSKIHDNLTVYNRFTKRIPAEKRDIGKIADQRELYNLVKDINPEEEHISAAKKEKIKRVLKQDASIEYEDNKWEVIIPRTPLASYELARSPLSNWCTAQAKDSYRHVNYSKEGPLYMIRDKTDIVPSGVGAGDPRPVYQFHFPSEQFMNAEDDRIDLVQFLNENEGLKQFFKPIFEKTWNHKDFDVEDSVFQMYTKLYGTSEQTMKLIKDILKNKVTDNRDLFINDDTGEFRGLVSIFGHDQFIQNLFEFVGPNVVTLEIAYKNYKGKGIVIPEKLGALTKINNVVFFGFVKSLPASIGNLTNLIMFSVANNPLLASLPSEMSRCKELEILNINKTAINEVPPGILDLETNGKLLIMRD